MHKGKIRFLRGLIFVVLTILVATLLILGADKNPIECYKVFFRGIFGSLNGFTEVFVKATPLMLAGLGIAIGFRSGFFNIGAEGQMYMGAIAATAVALLPINVPNGIHVLLCMLAAFLAAGLWAFIPGILKARFGISEIINTLMFNYIAFDIAGILVRGGLQDKTDYLPQSPVLVPSLSCVLEPTRLHTGFLLALAMTLVVWWIMERTPAGYEMQIVGSNKRAAQCLGVNVMRGIVLASFLGGGLAGLAGASELLGIQHRLLEGLVGSNGYTAILVALLGRNKPWGVCASAIGFAALQVGANTMQRQMGIPASIVSILTGFIVLLLLCDSLLNEWLQRKKEATH
ncbi:MAG: ABC transporter permease [Clostridia bacterium]